MTRKPDTPRTFVIKFFNKTFHCYYYLSRMPSKDHGPEFNHDCNEAIRFTSVEAQTARESLRKFFCNRFRTVDESYYKESLSFFGDLYIDAIGPKEIIDGEARTFLLWMDKYHHDALADRINEYIHSQQNA